MEYFEFEDEFKNNLDMFTIPDDNGDNIVRGIISFNPPVTVGGHIIDKEGIGKVVNTDGGVLLGKMSFQMTADAYDTSWFHLVEDSEYSPNTGIKIMIDSERYYEKQSTFRFTDKTASKDADLTDLVLSSGVKEGENPTYKEYELTPTFNKDTLDYEVTLLEYLDTMDIKATLSDTKSIIKIKVPKKDEDGNLVYEEKDSQSDEPFTFTLNELGEPDTVVTVIVTAEDGKTTKEYELVIKRPYGTLKGNIKYDTIEENENPDIVKITDLNFYETGKFNWDELKDIFGEIYDNPATYDDLDLIDKDLIRQSEEDGTFEIYVIPRTYDLQIDKRGFLDYIVTNISVSEGDIIDLDDITLIAGDVDRDRSNRTRGYSNIGS